MHITCNSRVLMSRLDSDAVLLNPDTGRYYALNPVGARIWELLQSEDDMDAICAQMLQEYAVEPERLYGDVRMLIDRLADAGLVTLREA